MYKKGIRVRRRTGGAKKAITKARYTRKPKAIVNAVAKVNSKINRIAKAMPPTNRLFYHTLAKTSLDNLGSPYTAYNLTKFSNWGRIFGTNADDEICRSARLRSMRVQHFITHQNPTELDSTQTCTYTYFLVKLKKRASYLLDETTGDLKTLTNGTHYVTMDRSGAGSLGGAAMINREFFKIIKYKRFVLGNYNNAFSSGVVVPSLDRRWDDKIYFGFDVTNPASTDWKSSIMPQNPQQNYFAILFCDNVLVDREPLWTWQQVSSVDTY